ncbi:MAG: glycosyl hydrolase 108 family protein, partial [Pseudomonadota bacterium]
YSNHPADRGGPTRWGVTQQVARAYGYAGDMRVLPRETAVAIYRRQYWVDPGFETVAQRFPAVAVELFDIGVNMGTGVAAKFLQRVLNVFNSNGEHYADLTADGRLGALTAHALDGFRKRRGVEGGERLLEAIRSLRGARYIELCEGRPANEAFAYGWLGRMVEMLKARSR